MAARDIWLHTKVPQNVWANQLVIASKVDAHKPTSTLNLKNTCTLLLAGLRKEPQQSKPLNYFDSGVAMYVHTSGLLGW